jgi:hypothetical protein
MLTAKAEGHLHKKQVHAVPMGSRLPFFPCEIPFPVNWPSGNPPRFGAENRHAGNSVLKGLSAIRCGPSPMIGHHIIYFTQIDRFLKVFHIFPHKGSRPNNQFVFSSGINKVVVSSPGRWTDHTRGNFSFPTTLPTQRISFKPSDHCDSPYIHSKKEHNGLLIFKHVALGRLNAAAHRTVTAVACV